MAEEPLNLFDRRPFINRVSRERPSEFMRMNAWYAEFGAEFAEPEFDRADRQARVSR